MTGKSLAAIRFVLIGGIVLTSAYASAEQKKSVGRIKWAPERTAPTLPARIPQTADPKSAADVPAKPIVPTVAERRRVEVLKSNKAGAPRAAAPVSSPVTTAKGHSEKGM